MKPILRISTILVITLAAGCVSRGQFNTGGGKDVRYDGDRPYAVLLSQPTLCSDYPVEYRRYLPSKEGRSISWELRLLSKSRNPCAPSPGTTFLQLINSVVEGVIQ